MATYEEKVYAIDSFLRVPVSGAITRENQLTAYTNYYFETGAAGTSSQHWTEDLAVFSITYPEETGAGAYAKKKKISQVPHVYVVTKTSSASGDMPAGSDIVYGLDVTTYVYRDVADAVYGERFENIADGAYVRLPSRWQSTQKTHELFLQGGPTGSYYANTSYNIRATMTFQTHTGTNKPYILYTYEDVIPSVRNPYPQSGFVNEKADTVFGWTFYYPTTGVAEKLSQASAKFRWRPAGTGAHKEIVVEGERNTITIPAGTFSTENIEWQVVVTSDDGIEGTPSAWYTLTTVDSLSEAIPEYPVSTFCDGSEPITMTWKHVIDTGSNPSGFDIQYSGDEGLSWIDLVKGVQSANMEYTVPADTFPAGRISWRVRTYNSDRVVGEWSKPAAFINQAAPPAPVASIEILSTRPTIRWQSVGQQAYQIQAEDYDSGQLYGVEKRFKIPVFLPDGPVNIRVRVQNSFGLWSAWGVVSATIANVPPGGIRLQTGTETESAVLTWMGLPEAAYYVHRDGVPIAKTGGTTYEDQMAVGPHTYTVLAVDEADNYAVSNPVHHETIIRGVVLGLLPNPEWIALKCRRGGRPTHKMSIQPVVTYHHYAGRALPVADVSPFRTVTDNFSFTVLNGDTLDRLDEMTGKLVMYKDGDGKIVVGILERLYADVRRKSDVEFTIHRTDWSEEIEYTV